MKVKYESTLLTMKRWMKDLHSHISTIIDSTSTCTVVDTSTSSQYDICDSTSSDPYTPFSLCGSDGTTTTETATTTTSEAARSAAHNTVLAVDSNLHQDFNTATCLNDICEHTPDSRSDQYSIMWQRVVSDIPSKFTSPYVPGEGGSSVCMSEEKDDSSMDAGIDALVTETQRDYNILYDTCNLLGHILEANLMERRKLQNIHQMATARISEYEQQIVRLQDIINTLQGAYGDEQTQRKSVENQSQMLIQLLNGKCRAYSTALVQSTLKQNRIEELAAALHEQASKGQKLREYVSELEQYIEYLLSTLYICERNFQYSILVSSLLNTMVCKRVQDIQGSGKCYNCYTSNNDVSLILPTVLYPTQSSTLSTLSSYRQVGRDRGGVDADIPMSTPGSLNSSSNIYR
uniref:Unconventional myosin-XVIIIb n=1 Tax=Lygus hesperus TaxID=30085 RepID=A0A0A9X9Y8_LYGHE